MEGRTVIRGAENIPKNVVFEEVELAGSRLLFSNTLWNLLGEGLPLIVAVGAIPPLIHGLGTERFGVLAISWMVVGYLSIFDLGLGRALTKFVAERMVGGGSESVTGLFWTTVWIMVVIGVVSMAALLVGSHLLIGKLLRIPLGLRAEARSAFLVIALTLPLIVVNNAFKGFLAAIQRFDLINAVRIPLSVSSYLAPLMVLQFSSNLKFIIGALVLIRAAASIVQLILCLCVVPSLMRNIRFRFEFTKPMFTFGSWVTVSNILGPLLAYSERFFLGSLVSMAAVTYYSTPYEMIWKVSILPASIAQVMFPAFSYTLAKDSDNAVPLLERINKYVFGILFPAVLLVLAFAPEVLKLWLGGRFASISGIVSQFFAIGMLLSGLSYVPAALVQAAGRPDLFTLLLLIETPLYLPLAWVMIGRFGIYGAAFVWLVRLAMNFAVLLFFVARLLPSVVAPVKTISIQVLLAIGVLALGVCLPTDLMTRTVYAVVILGAYGFLGWRLILDHEERNFVSLRLRMLRGVGSSIPSP